MANSLACLRPEALIRHWRLAGLVSLRHWQLGGLVLLAHLGCHAQMQGEVTVAILPGDTLIGISQRYLDEPRRWPELKRLNHIKVDTRLQPGTQMRIPRAWLRWSERAVAITYVQGQVKGVLVGVNKTLSAGMQLRPGDSFDTGASGALTLRLFDGATLVFPPRTQAVLGRSHEVQGTALRDTAIELKNGSVDSAVPPLGDPASRFEIRTPRVVTAVRGTRFRVNADGDISRHEVVSGVVAVLGGASSNGPSEASSGAPGAASGEARLNEEQGLRAEAGRLGTPVRLLPAADVSNLPRRIERTAQNLSVPPLTGAQGWHWQVAADTAFNQLLQDEQTTPPSWLLTGLPDGDYQLRVRASDGQQLEGLDAQVAIELRARPEPPVLIAPGSGDSVVAASELVWTEGINAPGYQVQVARDALFADLVLDRTPVTGNRLVLDAGWPPGPYHWRVATLRPTPPAGGARSPFEEGPRGPFGDSATFTLLPPSVMAPPQVSAAGLQLAWSGPAGFSHKVQMDSDASFARPQVDQVVPGASLELPTPAPGVYFVRTQVMLPDGRVGAWSSPQSFEVPKKPPWGWLLLLLLLPLL